VYDQKKEIYYFYLALALLGATALLLGAGALPLHTATI
jgi:hypothetical protein